MRRIVAISSPEKVWELPEIVSTYLAAFTYPWLNTHGLLYEPTCRFLLTAEQREGLKDVLQEALRHSVDRLYPGRPSERQLTIHPSRFERIELDGKSYLVNNTFFPGWLIYALHAKYQAVNRNLEVEIVLTPLPPE